MHSWSIIIIINLKSLIHDCFQEFLCRCCSSRIPGTNAFSLSGINMGDGLRYLILEDDLWGLEVWLNPVYLTDRHYTDKNTSGHTDKVLHKHSCGIKFSKTILIFDGYAEIGAHVRSELCYLILLRHLIRSRAYIKVLGFFMCSDTLKWNWKNAYFLLNNISYA